jgi:hypothetical protein
VAAEDRGMSGVTNTQLDKKLDKLTLKTETMADVLNAHKLAQEARMTYIETLLTIMKEDIEDNTKDIDSLKKRDYIVGGVTGLLATIAGILGVNK